MPKTHPLICKAYFTDSLRLSRNWPDAALNPPRAGEASVERFGFTYRVGDKVMQVENNYDRETFNGDLGFISRIDDEKAEITVAFDGRAVEYAYGELDEVT